METPQQDQPNAEQEDQDAGPTLSAEQLDDEPEREQAEGDDT
jgi:hypothetical protein